MCQRPRRLRAEPHLVAALLGAHERAHERAMTGAVADFSNIWKSVKAVPPVQSEPDIFTQQQLGHYRLLHSIGEG